MRVAVTVVLALIALGGCRSSDRAYKILGNIEEPQNKIAVTIAEVLRNNSGIDIQAVAGRGSSSNLDSLEAGVADFAIVDNHCRFSSKVSSLMPLYSQVLHILHKRDNNPATLRELLLSGKIFAGIEGSGTHTFVIQLIEDLGLTRGQIQFVDINDIFHADVIFSFTDLLTQNELKDLTDFQMFSIDNVEHLGKGSLAEGICMRHPQFEPFVLSQEVYGPFTEKPILTIKVDAVLVCRNGIDTGLVYDMLTTLSENREVLQNINPQLFNVAGDFDPRRLTIALHQGARNYRDRNEPTLLERYADLFSVILSITFTAGSGIYTLSRWQKARKKNKIDTFYQKVMKIRSTVALSDNPERIMALERNLKSIQEETFQLVVKEKLMADESFSIFLNLSKIVMDEIQSRMKRFDKYNTTDAAT